MNKNLALIILVFLTTFVAASDFNETVEFCKDRPLGLYCSPYSTFQKIECPSMKFFTCPKAPNEMCQERGIIRQHGFRGGIARCVPRIDPAAISQFCESRKKGVYCWGDTENNLRVHCPSGLIYKCADEPTDKTKKCDQVTDTFATCSSGGGGAGSVTCLPITIMITETVTATSQQTLTPTCDPETVDVTQTATASEYVTATQVESVTDSQFFTQTATESDTVTSKRTVTVTSMTTESGGGGAASSATIIIPTTDTVTKTVTTEPTSTSSVGPSFSTEITVITSTEVFTITPEPTSSNTQTNTTTETATSTETGGGGGAGGSSTVIIPTETPSACPPDGSPQTSIATPPGTPYTYELTSQPLTRSAAESSCKELGGRLAFINSTSEHWWLGQQLCQPVWYSRWEDNSYSNDCIALYPGGATARPEAGCEQEFIGLCQVNN